MATVLVIAASVAVLLLTIGAWQRNGQERLGTQVRREVAIPVPDTPEPLDGARLLGNKAAKVAIIEYSDFQCPFCASHARDTWPMLKTEYVDAGKVVVAFRHLPLDDHPVARPAAVSAECAGEQGRFWEMHQLLFERQLELHEKIWPSLAANLGLNAVAFEECLKRSGTKVDDDRRSATKLGVSATPTFLIGLAQSGGTVRIRRVLVGSQPFELFKDALDELLDTSERVPWSTVGSRLSWNTAKKSRG
jgi:protein-disulfide isomerase